VLYYTLVKQIGFEMNERIRELEGDANDYADAHWERKCPQWHQFYTEKFAELIVRECMDIAKNWEDQLENSSLLEESNAVGVVAYRIARQFGVKE
jgi:hypothetical protein